MATNPSTTTAMQTAAANGSARDPQQGCADCKKSGLAILPVVPMPLPNDMRMLNGEFMALSKHYKGEELKTHWYALRTLPTGYLYVLRPDMTWDGYIVDSEGLLRGMPPGQMPASPSDVTPMSQACKRNSDNIPAQVIAIDPTKHAAVWVAFSRFRWTSQVLADYAANKEGRRDKRMTKIDVMAAANGSFPASKAVNAVRFGAPMGAGALGHYVADYASPVTCEAINQRVLTPVRQRIAQSRELISKMADISKNTTGKTGVIIALRDDLGVTMELNGMRNAETGKLMEYIAENQRKYFIGNTIKGFEKAFIENGQGKEWNERFRDPCYNYNQLNADLKAYEKETKPREEKINAISNDVALLNGAEALKAWWRDFDPGDDQSAKDRQDATAFCLHGAVKTPAEQALWDKWFKEDPKDLYATLWGAVTALDPKLGDFLIDIGLLDDKLYDIVNGIGEAKEKFFEWLQKRSSASALGMIGTAMSSQVARLKSVNPALYRVAGARVFIIIAARTGITMTPFSITVTQTQAALMMAEAAFGPPQASIKRLLNIEATSGKRVFVVGSNGVDAYAYEQVNRTTQKTRVVELWLPDEVATKISPQAKLPAGPVLKALPRPVNPFQSLKEFTKSMPGAFAWVGMTLQAINLISGTKEFIGTKDNTADAYAGLASGVLGVAGATGEIAAGTMGNMLARKMAVRFTITKVMQVALGGGLLAGLSAWAEAVQLGIKAGQSFGKDDVDATFWYAGAAVCTFLFGVATIGGALAAASSAGVLTGGLAFLATAGTAAVAIPVWGWIAAGVILLGVGLAMLWQAIRATDTPLETWLKHCIYGKYPKYSLKEEAEKLNDVAYAMTIAADWDDAPLFQLRRDNYLDHYDSVNFSISLPGIGAASSIYCKITLIGKSGRQEVFRETIRPRMLGGNAFDPHMAVVGPYTPGSQTDQPNYVWYNPPGIRGTSYTGQLKVNDSIYSRVEIEIQYWPDTDTMPNFVLPKAVDQQIMIVEDGLL